MVSAGRERRRKRRDLTGRQGDREKTGLGGALLASIRSVLRAHLVANAAKRRSSPTKNLVFSLSPCLPVASSSLVSSFGAVERAGDWTSTRGTGHGPASERRAGAAGSGSSGSTRQPAPSRVHFTSARSSAPSPLTS